MKFDIFLSICQTEVDGFIPSEREMFANFFDQVQLADRLGFETAWVAESHLSCEVQKANPNAVIPQFKGEIGLNTDILQLAHKVFQRTARIQVGSAIRNILCNGGPLAHAEALKTFLSLHGMDPKETRKIFLGFAAGRFPFSNEPYGIKPRSEWEELAWPVIKGLLFQQATEIFLRALGREAFSSRDLKPMLLRKELFRREEEWNAVSRAYDQHAGGAEAGPIEVKPFWSFDRLGVIPFEAPLHLLQLVAGSHDPAVQQLANEFFPSWVFNLSITPSATIEQTHQRMAACYHADGGIWKREYMPRTALIFINGDERLDPLEQRSKAREAAHKAIANYWKAIEGTLDQKKIAEAVENAVYGNPADVAAQLQAKYDASDRLMLWFDFNNHDNEAIKASMEAFWHKSRPLIKE